MDVVTREVELLGFVLAIGVLVGVCVLVLDAVGEGPAVTVDVGVFVLVGVFVGVCVLVLDAVGCRDGSCLIP